MKRDVFLNKMLNEAETNSETGKMTIFFKDLTPESRTKIYELIKSYDENADAFSDEITKKKIDLYLFGGQREDGSTIQPLPVSIVTGSQLRDNMTL